MATSIDVNNGSIHLDSGVVLVRDISLQQIVAMGGMVHRDLDMKTGWHLISIGPNGLFGKSANLALLMFKDELKQVHFTLLEAGVTAPEDIRKLHDNVLMTEFGTPQVHDERRSIYKFPWGTLVSEYDPRGGQAEMVMSWT